jgi:hypothetical protein
MSKDTTTVREEDKDEKDVSTAFDESDNTHYLLEGPSLSELVQNPSLIDEYEYSAFMLLYLTIQMMVYLILTVYRAIPSPIRAGFLFIAGGYMYDFWKALDPPNVISSFVTQFAVSVSSLSPGLLILAASILGAGFIVAYAIWTTSSQDSQQTDQDSNLRPDGGRPSMSYFEKFLKRGLEMTSPDALYPSPYGAIIGGLIGILVGGLFGSDWVFAFGFAGLAIGEEVGYWSSNKTTSGSENPKFEMNRQSSGVEFERSQSEIELFRLSRTVLFEEIQEPATVYLILKDGTIYVGQTVSFNESDEVREISLYAPYRYTWNNEKESYQKKALQGELTVAHGSIDHMLLWTENN